MRGIMVLRLRALLARAHGHNDAYRDMVRRYRAMAESLGFDGHIAWAEAMIGGGDQSVTADRPPSGGTSSVPN